MENDSGNRDNGGVPISEFLRQQAQIKVIVRTHRIMLKDKEEISSEELAHRIGQFYDSFEKPHPEGTELLMRWGRLLKLRRQGDQVQIILK